VVLLAACSLVYTAAHLIRLAAGADLISCLRSDDVDSASSGHLVSGDLRSSWCVVTLVLLYFFGMAAALWWVALAGAFYLAAGRKWSGEAIADVSGYFHVAAWSLPAVKTAVVLALRRFAGDELTGLCYVDVGDSSALVGLVLAPLVVYLLSGVALVVAGFVAMFRIRHSLVELAAPRRQLETLMVKVGAFAVLYTVPATVVVACWFYEALYSPGWRRAAALAPCPGRDCRLDASPAPMAVGALRVLASLAAGATSIVWLCSPRKTIHSWRRRFCSMTPPPPPASKCPPATHARDLSRDLSARSRDFRLAVYR